MKKGIYTFVLLAFIFSNGCNKDNGGTPAGAKILTGKLDGVDITAQGTAAGQSATSSHWGASNENINTYVGGSWISLTSSTTYGYIKMFKNFLNQSTNPTSQQLYDMYTPNPYPYVLVTSADTEGVAIAIRDGSGTMWYSWLGDNTGSTFTIGSRGSYNAMSTTFSGSFSCTVYDGNGNHKTFVGTFTAVGATF